MHQNALMARNFTQRVNAPRRHANLTVCLDLLERAKQRRINLSRLLERELTNELQRYEARDWLAANKEAIDAYNVQIEKRGVFSRGLRRF